MPAIQVPVIPDGRQQLFLASSAEFLLAVAGFRAISNCFTQRLHRFPCAILIQSRPACSCCSSASADGIACGDFLLAALQLSWLHQVLHRDAAEEILKTRGDKGPRGTTVAY